MTTESRPANTRSAIRLMLEGDWWLVAIEDENGKWVEIIREHKDSAAASHIVEPAGIAAALEKARG